MQFFVGLHDGFEQARSQILMMNPLPSVDRAYSIIVQVEDQKGLTDNLGEIDARVAMQIGKALKYRNGGNTDFKRRMSKEERLKLKCSHCNNINLKTALIFLVMVTSHWRSLCVKPKRIKGFFRHSNPNRKRISVNGCLRFECFRH